MRKEDKASGTVRIPYAGEEKSTRYCAPLAQAFKGLDMQLVNEHAKEKAYVNTKNGLKKFQPIENTIYFLCTN